jgi:uncharacterized Ntn-hydrolase superfamily protein
MTKSKLLKALAETLQKAEDKTQCQSYIMATLRNLGYYGFEDYAQVLKLAGVK